MKRNVTPTGAASRRSRCWAIAIPALSGARRLSFDRAGNLVVSVHGGSVRELAPRAYQTVGGVRRPVASRCVIEAGDRVGVRVGDYDHARALVIDPVLSYLTYLGGSSVDRGNGIVAAP